MNPCVICGGPTLDGGPRCLLCDSFISPKRYKVPKYLDGCLCENCSAMRCDAFQGVSLNALADCYLHIANESLRDVKAERDRYAARIKKLEAERDEIRKVLR